MFKFLKQKNKRNRAFTLVETLIAISIFTVSILGLITVLSKGVSDTGYAKKKVTASYLAQEGIEYVRNLRDTLVVNPDTNENAWGTFETKTAPCENGAHPNGCYFNESAVSFSNDNRAMESLTFTSCSSPLLPSGCPESVLYFHPKTGKYNLISGDGGVSGDGGILTDFKRIINTQNITNDETKITSVVSWTQGSGTYSISFSENIFNWQ